jgi:hypothetical protein
MSDIHIHDYGTGDQPTGQTWNTTQLQEDFTVEAFQAPFVVVTRKADGVRGMLEFSHSPRVYFGFKEI